MKILAIALAVVILVLLGALFLYNPKHSPTASAPSVAQGSQTQTSMVSADGHLTVLSPRAGDMAASPLTIAGQVTGGGWFFEASFPIKILDGDGTVIGGGQAKAQGDWTSTGSVPFAVAVSFTAPHYATGTIVLWKDNPSGLPENDASFTVPVRFK